MPTATPADVLFFEPAERRAALLDLIATASRTLQLSIFRCEDPGFAEALIAARRRGVDVRVIVTNTAKHSEQQLEMFSLLLRVGGIGVQRYPGPCERYHAKYLIADHMRAAICSMNLTVNHFERTHDVLYITGNPTVIGGLRCLFDCDRTGVDVGLTLPPQLIVSPLNARARMASLLRSARRSVLVADHKFNDPDLERVLEEVRETGVRVEIAAYRVRKGLKAHGKAVVIDGRLTVVGSMALTRKTLDERRDLAVVLDDARLAGQVLAQYSTESVSCFA